VSDLKLIILGNGAAVPTSYQNPTSQLLVYKGKQFMIDCGEGTQMQMIKFKIRHRKLNHIFISHMHGDHYYGLIGLLSTFHLYGREEPLTISAPAALEGIIKLQLEAAKMTLKYKLIFQYLEEMGETPLCEDDSYTINAFTLKHSVPSWGFVFREKPRLRRIRKLFIEEKKLIPEQIINIKQGNDFVDSNGISYLNSEITESPRESSSYAYCSDTAYSESVIEHIRGVDLLYHESTFDNAMEKIAIEKKHSTAAHAAMIAEKSNAKKLLLGHFSARFSNLNILLDEAKVIFPNTVLSKEGLTYII